MLHHETPCRHGAECWTKACAYRHADDTKHATPCRYREKCTARACPYMHLRWHGGRPEHHPSEVNCRYGAACKNRGGDRPCPYHH